MLIDYKRGQGSIVLRVKLFDSAVSTGAGKTGLTFSSTGLIISTIANNEAAAGAVYTAAGSTIETITTLGTYAAPTATKCRFKEVDATNHKGIYEIQIADARFAVSNAKALIISISGVSGVAECDVLIPLRDVDPYDAVRFGMTALPNAAANAVGGLGSVVFRAGTLPAQTGASAAAGTVNLASGGVSATDEMVGARLLIFSAAFVPRGSGLITATDNANDRVMLNGGTALGYTPTAGDTYIWTLDPMLTGLSKTQIAAAMFTEDTGTNYAAAHANSVVKQTASNATGASAPTIASAVRTELATELARLDVATSTRASQTTANAIDAKTTNLPSDPADQSLIVAATDAIMARLGVPAAASLAADLAAINALATGIKAKTDQLVFSGGVLQAAMPSNIKKNQALANFKFIMRAATTHQPITGAVVTMAVAIDGGAFANITGSVVEVSAGWYRCSFLAAEFNGNVLALHAEAPGCDPFDLTIITQP